MIGSGNILRMDGRGARVKAWFSRFWRQLMDLSLTDRIVAVVVGIVGGIFPMPSITTLVTLFLARLMSCTPPQIALSTSVNLVLAPVDIYLLPKFATLTSVAMGYEVTYTGPMLLEMINQGVLHLITAGGTMILMAIVSWVFIAMGILVATTVILNWVPHGKFRKEEP